MTKSHDKKRDAYLLSEHNIEVFRVTDLKKDGLIDDLKKFLGAE